MSNQDIIEGKVKQVLGRIQDAYGDLVHDPEQDVKGKIKQAEGKAQETAGHIDNAIRETAQAHDK